MSNREILFRGKRFDTGDWIEGTYAVRKCDGDRYIITWLIPSVFGNRLPNIEANGFLVYPETIGQSTSMKDIDGNRIFEDDILRFTMYGQTYTGVVTYKKGAFLVALTEPLKYSFCMTATVSIDDAYRYGAVVIGNVHDNPEHSEI